MSAADARPATDITDQAHDAGGVTVRLPFRAPFDGDGLLAFLAARAVRGVEEATPGGYRRSLALPGGTGVMELAARADHVQATFWLEDERDLGPAIDGCRRLLDLDADPAGVVRHLRSNPVVGDLVRAVPGRRVPGHSDGGELAIRAVLGQQVSVAAATTLAAALVARLGEPLSRPVGAVTHLFPTPASLAALDPDALPMPRSRARTVIAVADGLSRGTLRLDDGAERTASIAALRAVPGIGPWTAGYVAMRALHDPDAFVPGDSGIRHALELLGRDPGLAATARLAERWRPYRAYATVHLWSYVSQAPRRTMARTARQHAWASDPVR